jgi:choline dehydrogenase
VFEGTRCVGVEIARDGRPEVLRAAQEVVVSAGTIESPKLLMLSGIGDPDELGRHDIGVVAALPGVGRNLHDHTLSPMIFAAGRPVPPMLFGLVPQHAHLFWYSRPGLASPDLQPLCFHNPLYEPWMSGPEDAFTLLAGHVRPASRGRIRLASADPGDAPRMDPAYLSCAADVDALVASVELNREIAAQPAFADWSPRELYPGPGAHGAELRDYVRRSVITYHHQVGTCKMGIDDEAVVDPELRVYGVEGLRVADASIMPAVTTGNTVAPAIMIGERAADLVGAGLGREAAAAVAHR